MNLDYNWTSLQLRPQSAHRRLFICFSCSCFRIQCSSSTSLMFFTLCKANSSLCELCSQPNWSRRTEWIIHGQTDGKCEGEPVSPAAGTDLDSGSGSATGRERPLRKCSTTQELHNRTVRYRKGFLIVEFSDICDLQLIHFYWSVMLKRPWFQLRCV